MDKRNKGLELLNDNPNIVEPDNNMSRYKDPERTALSEKIAKDIAKFEAAGGVVQYLPSSMELRNTSIWKTRRGLGHSKMDMTVYCTESDIVTERSKKGLLPVSVHNWRRMVAAGKVEYPHRRIRGEVPVWRRDYIKTLAENLALKAKGRTKEQ